MLQFGMPTLIENKTLEDNIQLCKDFGLKFIELNMNFPEYQLKELKNTKKFFDLASEAGIYYTIHLDEKINIADFNLLVRKAYLRTIKKTISIAKSLLPLQNRFGNKSMPFVINMHMNHGVYMTLPKEKIYMYDRNLNIYLDCFKQFRSLCEKWIGNANIIIAIENTDGFLEYEKTAIDYLLESPKFGLTWDIGHSKAIGETDVPFIILHKDKLQHFHIHDATTESKTQKANNHLALGDGEINIKDRLITAEKTNSRCVIETKTISALSKSVAYLSDIVC